MLLCYGLGQFITIVSSSRLFHFFTRPGAVNISEKDACSWPYFWWKIKGWYLVINSLLEMPLTSFWQCLSGLHQMLPFFICSIRFCFYAVIKIVSLALRRPALWLRETWPYQVKTHGHRQVIDRPPHARSVM